MIRLIVETDLTAINKKTYVRIRTKSVGDLTKPHRSNTL